MRLDPSRSISGSFGGIIAVGNLEGGMGKSTLAVGLAGAMARTGKSVALVDSDLRRTLPAPRIEAAGVDTVEKLRTRHAGKLASRMAEVDAEKKLTRVVPTETMAGGWIEEAESMAPILTFERRRSPAAARRGRGSGDARWVDEEAVRRRRWRW